MGESYVLVCSWGVEHNVRTLTRVQLSSNVRHGVGAWKCEDIFKLRHVAFVERDCTEIEPLRRIRRDA